MQSERDACCIDFTAARDRKKKAPKAERSHWDLSVRTARACVGENAVQQSKQVVPSLQMKNDNPRFGSKKSKVNFGRKWLCHVTQDLERRCRGLDFGLVPVGLSDPGRLEGFLYGD